MRAGLLTEPITIYEKIITTNDFGEETEEWVVKYTTRARLVNDGGDRTIINGEIFYSNAKTFQVRTYVPVDEYDEIKWDNKLYRILSIQPDKSRMNKTIRTELIND
jgi:head-tail adaptor